MKLSIIVPVYNEEKTVGKTIERLVFLTIPNLIKEIIIVDDGSADATASEIKSQISNLKNVKLASHERNLGKGSAIKTGIQESTGDYIIIQDADLEYNPLDIEKLLEPIIKGNAQVVYGTRLKRLPHFKAEEKTLQFFIHYIGNKCLSFIASMLYGQWLTDIETGYKLFPRKAVSSMELLSKGFEFEPEITAKLLKAGYTIVEVPITTVPRSYKEGKKLRTFSDGIKAMYFLVKYRFVN